MCPWPSKIVNVGLLLQAMALVKLLDFPPYNTHVFINFLINFLFNSFP